MRRIAGLLIAILALAAVAPAVAPAKKPTQKGHKVATAAAKKAAAKNAAKKAAAKKAAAKKAKAKKAKKAKKKSPVPGTKAPAATAPTVAAAAAPAVAPAIVPAEEIKLPLGPPLPPVVNTDPVGGPDDSKLPNGQPGFGELAISRFFTGGGGTASAGGASGGETKTSEAVVITLATPPADTNPGGYAGAEITGFDPVPTLDEPSFTFTTPNSGASAGSPRLDVFWSDGGSSSLRPLTLVANTPTTVGGGTDWDNNYGGCGYRYAISWADVVACHAGETITGLQVVLDSGYSQPSVPWSVQITDVQFGGSSLNTAFGELEGDKPGA